MKHRRSDADMDWALDMLADPQPPLARHTPTGRLGQPPDDDPVPLPAHHPGARLHRKRKAGDLIIKLGDTLGGKP